MKKIVLILVLGLLFAACKDEKKKDTPVKDVVETEEVKKEVDNTYPKVSKDYPFEMDFIYEKGYLFDDKIQLEEISVVPSGKPDMYDILFFFNEKTDFKALDTYKLGVVFFPKDPTKLGTEKERAAKKKKVAVKGVKMLSDDHVIEISNFNIPTKDFRMLKIYLYDTKGVLNENYLKIANVVFP